MRFKLDWASLIVESKFTVFAHCLTLYLRAIFQVQAPGGLYLEGRFNGGFFALPVGGLIFGGAYFRIFTVFSYRSETVPRFHVKRKRISDRVHK